MIDTACTVLPYFRGIIGNAVAFVAFVAPGVYIHFPGSF